MLDGGSVMFTDERMARQHVDFTRTKTVTKHIEKEEIVQLIRADKVFRLLLDMTIDIGRHQFRTDWRVRNVTQDCGGIPLQPGGGRIVHQTADERLRNTRIDAIHAHVIAIISGPAQS